MSEHDSDEFGAARVVLAAPYDGHEWLRARTRGIGGSDAATIAGLNPYRSALELWHEKTTGEQSEAEPLTPANPMWWGHALEDDIDTAFRETTGIMTIDPPGLLANKSRPWQLASVDRITLDEHDEENGIAEYKTTGLRMSHEWIDDELPARALLQVQHYLAVTGFDVGYVAGLIGGQRFVVKRVPRDDSLIDQLTELEAEFWQRVQTGEPPRPDGSESAQRAIRRRFPEAHEPGVLLDDKVISAIGALRVLDARIKSEERMRERLRQEIQLAMGKHSIGYVDDRPLVRWTNVTTRRIDTAALRDAYPDVAEKYTRTTTTRRFTLAPDEE